MIILIKVILLHFSTTTVFFADLYDVILLVKGLEGRWSTENIHYDDAMMEIRQSYKKINTQLK